MQHERLKSTLDAILEHAGKIDAQGGYTAQGSAPLRKTVTLDLLKFLLHLSGTGLNAQEVDFINDVLGLNYRDYEYATFYTDLKAASLPSAGIPASWAVFSLYDAKNPSQGTPLAALYTEFMRILGISFISCDSNASDDEVLRLTDYVLTLRKPGQDVPAPGGPKAAEEGGDGAAQPAPEAPKARPFDEIMAELNSLTGLEDVKKDVESLISLVKVRKIREERGFAQPAMSLHMVFTGNPGTGKTTVARLLSELYLSIGLLSKGHLFETDRSGLVAGYVGQTALKVAEAVKSAMGGILFIDEAYALSSGHSSNDFGFEAVTTLLKLMEDNRGDLIVVAAGYTDLMEEFLSSNPGLKSRFNKFIFFKDYSADELVRILESNFSKMSLRMTKKTVQTAREFFEARTRDKPANFANARDARNYFEKALTNQANRLAKLPAITDEMLGTVIFSDVRDIALS